MREDSRIELAVAVVIVLMVILAAINFYIIIYFTNELALMQAKLTATLVEVDEKLLVNEEVTRSIVNGINGGW